MSDICKYCNGTETIMGYGYGSDGKGGIQQYRRPMACQHCNSGTFTTIYTPSNTCECVAPDCKKLSNCARNDYDDLPDQKLTASAIISLI